MGNEEMMELLLSIMQNLQNTISPPFQGMTYSPPIAEVRMEIVGGGGAMEYRTAGPDWKQADDMQNADGNYTISTIQIQDGVELPASNRIRELRWKAGSVGVAQNLVVRRV